MNDDVGFGALVGGAIVAVIAGLFAWLRQLTQGRADKEIAETAAQAAVEVAAVAEWQKLYNALSLRVSGLEQQLADVRRDHATEIEQLIKDHSEAMEAIRANHREKMKEIRDYCAGLERQIAQNSQSTAHLIEGKADKPKDGNNGK